MALFMTGTAKEKAAADVDIDALRKEITRMKQVAAIRARYKDGADFQDEQVDRILAHEADMAVRKAKAAEAAAANRQEDIKRDTEIRALAVELVRDGKILISVDGHRIESLTPDLTITCPKCGHQLGSVSDAVYLFAKSWYHAPDSYDRIVHHFIIYSARSPLTEQGFSGYLQEPCPSCHERIMGVVQAVVI